MKDIFYVEKYAANHPTVEIIREAYHAFVPKVNDDETAIDIPCGCGFGTELLSRKAKMAVGFVQANEALSHALIRHRTTKSTFAYSKQENTIVAFPFDVAFSNWHDIEEGSDNKRLIETLKRALRAIVIAVPVGFGLPKITDDEWIFQSVEKTTGSDIYTFIRKNE